MKDVPLISLSMREDVSAYRAVNDVTALMHEVCRIGVGNEDDFSSNTMEQLTAMLSDIRNVLPGLLSAVAAVSLLFRGIGIEKIMLV